MQGGVRKRGSRWYYYFDIGVVDGKRKKVERVGGDTKKEAQEKLRIALSEIDNYGTLREESDMSFSDYLDYWVKEYVMMNCKHNTQESYKKMIKNHIRPSLGMYKLKNLNPAALQEFVNKKHSEGLARGTISNINGVLTSSLKRAVYPHGFIKENPSRYMSIPKKQIAKKNVRKIISKEEFSKILDRFPEGSTFYIPLQIAFHTGMRSGEVTALRWEDVDLNESIIEVNHTLVYKEGSEWELGTPKTESSIRSISIGPTLTKILKKHKTKQSENKLKLGRYYRDSDFVCTKKNGRHVNTNTLRYLSKIVNSELGIDFNFHALRHTHATMLLEAGANIKDIQVRLGHSKIATTMDTYSHVTQKMRNESVDIFESLIK